MTSKNTYILGGAGAANFSSFAEIPSYVTDQGDNTILVQPGTYDAPTNVSWNDVALVGLGDIDEIVINGDMTIANTSTGVLTFENLTFVGSNGSVSGGASCVTKLGAASTKLRFNNVNMTNAEHGVSHNGEPAFATTTKQVTLNFCDLTAVDQAIVANANVAVSYSALNASSAAYFQPGTGGGVPALTVTVRASTSGGSNTGNNTETVLALIA
jgi:hypothetical protein